MWPHRVSLVAFASALLRQSSAGPLRLTVSGSELIDPAGESIRLTGFNWVYTHLHDGDGALQKQLIPGANTVRAVGLLWDNIDDKTNECYSDSPPYLRDDCFEHLDHMIKQATDAGLWVIITCRSKYGAGQEFVDNPMGNVFHNETLRTMMYTMWQHVAERYKDWDHIAAYEIMSEARDKSATAQQVHDFYAGGCEAVHGVDPTTPCMVGPGSYYKLYLFTEDIIIKEDANIIYTFDYFDPDSFIFGRDKVPTYPGVYPCRDLYKGWASADNCPEGATVDTAFDSTWHDRNMERWVIPFTEKFKVPVFVNQWEVVHGVSAANGRFQFMSDVAKKLQELNIGWTWWMFRGGGSGVWADGSSEFVLVHPDGSLELDKDAAAAVAPYMGPAPPSPPSPPPAPTPPPTPVPPPSWSCQAGQGGLAAHAEVKRTGDNSEDGCGAQCALLAGCEAFDYTMQSRSDACRLFSTSDARLGDGGSQHRQYCASQSWSLV